MESHKKKRDASDSATEPMDSDRTVTMSDKKRNVTDSEMARKRKGKEEDSEATERMDSFSDRTQSIHHDGESHFHMIP